MVKKDWKTTLFLLSEYATEVEQSSCLSFSQLFCSRIAFLCFHFCLVSVRFKGPSLLVVNFHGKVLPLISILTTKMTSAFDLILKSAIKISLVHKCDWILQNEHRQCHAPSNTLIQLQNVSSIIHVPAMGPVRHTFKSQSEKIRIIISKP